MEDIGDIADQMEVVQAQLDRADSGTNPLGLAGDAVMFDLDPALTKTTPGGSEGARTSSRCMTRPSAWSTR